jgi:hypothetical protein
VCVEYLSRVCKSADVVRCASVAFSYSLLRRKLQFKPQRAHSHENGLPRGASVPVPKVVLSLRSVGPRQRCINVTVTVTKANSMELRTTREATN